MECTRNECNITSSFHSITYKLVYYMYNYCRSFVAVDVLLHCEVKQSRQREYDFN